VGGMKNTGPGVAILRDAFVCEHFILCHALGSNCFMICIRIITEGKVLEIHE
jgi:hypothetical protein